jgi:NitT/TauT family transport system substrate-binding protein
MVAALKGNQVDAIIIAPHLARPLVSSNSAHLLGWYSDYDEYQFGGLFTATKTAADRRELTQRFVRAYQKGCADYARAFMQKDRAGAPVFDQASEAAAKIVTKYVYPSEPEEKGVALVKASVFPADAQARLDVSDIYKQIAWMKSEKLVDEKVDPAMALDLSFVEGHFNLPK